MQRGSTVLRVFRSTPSQSEPENLPTRFPIFAEMQLIPTMRKLEIKLYIGTKSARGGTRSMVKRSIQFQSAEASRLTRFRIIANFQLIPTMLTIMEKHLFGFPAYNLMLTRLKLFI